MNSQQCIVIIPAKNEAHHIQSVVLGVHQFFSPGEVVVINDHSSDATPYLAREAGATVISHPISLGYAATLQTGYKYALARGYDYLIQLDGDGQHLPSSIPILYETLLAQEADLVVGNRFLHPKQYQTNFARHLGMRFFGKLVQKITHLQLSDTTSGFQGMTRAVFQWYTEEHFPRDFPDADILIHTHFRQFRIKEVPVEMEIPEGNISMHRGILRPMYYVIKMTLSILQILLKVGIFSRENR